jgi:hypothetical protein
VTDVQAKRGVAEALSGALRSGLLTIHQLTRGLMRQLLASFKLAAAGSAVQARHHTALQSALLDCLLALGASVDQVPSCLCQL